MALFSGVPLLGVLKGKVKISKIPDELKDKINEKVIEGQNRINEAEVSGGPVSRLRLWRSFLGWVLSLAFAWEVLGRGILSTYWPELRLPPPMLKEISHLLLGMLGLGF